MLVNTMDDFWNPGEMGVAEREMPKLKNSHFVLLPITEETRGHYTFFQAAHFGRNITSPTARRIERTEGAPAEIERAGRVNPARPSHSVFLEGQFQS